MGFSRYRKQRLIENANPEYNEILAQRGLSSITQYSFSSFKDLKIKDLEGIQLDTHIWEASDRLFKLADKYYGDPTYWWIIALFNNRPLESEIKLGEKMLIPLPLDMIVSAMEI